MNLSERTELPPVRSFDGLRGLLALWVTLAHVACWTGVSELQLPGPLNRLWRSLTSAQAAVDVFIILSGFVITFLLEQKQPGFRTFLRGRWYRIFPVYLVGLLAGMLITGLTTTVLATASWKATPYFVQLRSISNSEQTHAVFHCLFHLTLLNGLIPSGILPESTAAFLPPAWSISLEWQYYLVAPCLIWLLRSGVGFLCVVAVATAGTIWSAPWQNSHLAFLPAQLPLFLIGTACYRLYYASSVSASWSLSRSHVAAGFFVLAFITQWHPVALLLWGISFGCVLNGRSGPIGKVLYSFRQLLLWSPLQRLGRVSYPVYLLHWPVISISLFLLLKLYPAVTGLQAALILCAFAVPLVVLAATAVHVWIEVPWMKYGKKPVGDMPRV